MQKISVINQKGGVGKSTISSNLAYFFSTLNQRVLLIDNDPQAHCTPIYGDIGLEPNITTVYKDRSADPRQAIYPAKVNGNTIENLFLLPSNLHLAAVAEEVTARVHREKILFNALEKVRGDYDYVLIDCPPTLGTLAVNGIYAADEFLIPVDQGGQSLDGVADLFRVISDVKETDEYPYRIVCSKIDGRATKTLEYLERELEPVRDHVINTRIRKSEPINQAYISRQPIFTYEPNGYGVEDFTALGREVMNG